MATGRKNKLVGQAGEYLVCAQLAKRGFMATPFAGNVPVFDVLIADDQCRSVAIQVKASTGLQWRTDARLWLSMDFDPVASRQIYNGPLDLAMPDLLTVCVSLDMGGTNDRYFILTARAIQERVIKGYTWWMSQRDWKRPKNPQSYDSRFDVNDLEPFENRWELIADRLGGSPSCVTLTT